MKIKTVAYAALLYFWMTAGAQAGSITFSGNFTQDDNVRAIPIVVSVGGPLTATTYSYAGGVTSTGQAVARGRLRSGHRAL